MKVRKACEKDIPRMVELLHQVCDVHAEGRPDLFQHGGIKYTGVQLEQILKDEMRPILAAVDDEDILCGYAFCEIQDHRQDTAMTHIITMYIDDICVAETARGQHVGTLLYEAALSLAKERGCYNVTLNVWECNPTARKFYEAMGMKPMKTGMETIL